MSKNNLVLVSSKKRVSDSSESFNHNLCDKKIKTTALPDVLNDQIIEKFKEVGIGLNNWEYGLETVHQFNENQLVECLSLKGIYSRSEQFPAYDPKDIVKMQAYIGWELSYKLRELIKKYPAEFRAYCVSKKATKNNKI